MRYVYTDEELVQIVARLPLPTTARRFHRLMNRRMAKDTVYRRLNRIAKDGLLLSRKFNYQHRLGLVRVYGTGEQMAEFDKLWKENQGILGLSKMEEAWYV
jgi:hypothetical protein